MKIYRLLFLYIVPLSVSLYNYEMDSVAGGLAAFEQVKIFGGNP